MHQDPRVSSLEPGHGAARCAVLVLGAFAAMLAGCSGSGRAAPVDASRAREALTIALDGWKKGDSPSALKDGSPSITVQDLDWLGGARLLEYRVTGEGKAVEANLYVPVDLTLKTAQGRETKKSVSYVVGTSPIVTVFRDFR
jgi:hypothetical protein